LRPVCMVVVLLCLSTAAAQVVGPIPGVQPSLGPVGVLITSPETGSGLGPKFDLNQEFNLSYEVQILNLTVTNVSLHPLIFDEENETYLPLPEEWIVTTENVSWPMLRGPASVGGRFVLRIPDRGYYFLKVRADYEVQGRSESAEGGDIIFGPRVRVIPALSQRSYLVLVGMPILPLVAGVVVRTFRRRETRGRKRKPEPRWLEEMRRKEQ
jgi:hypothetical protein